MTEFENIIIGKSSIPALIITVILMIAIPVIFFIYWRRKHKEQTNISYLAVAVLFSHGDVENALSSLKITEETAAAALPSVEAAAAFDYGVMALNVIERLLAMFAHIGLTVIVYYGVVNSKKICLPMAIVLHMLADTFPALCQKNVLPLWAVEVWAAFWTAVILLAAGKLYKSLR